jgi:ketosteroid isomerase-like protein
VVAPGELRAVARAVVAFGTARGTRHDGSALEVPVIWTFKLRDDRVVAARIVATAAEAHAVLREAS